MGKGAEKLLERLCLPRKSPGETCKELPLAEGVLGGEGTTGAAAPHSGDRASVLGSTLGVCTGTFAQHTLPSIDRDKSLGGHGVGG